MERNKLLSKATEEDLLKLLEDSNELVIENKGNKEKTDFEISNSLGQVVFKGSLLQKTIVNTSEFASGVYLIKIKNGKSFEFRKIVKE